MEKAGRIFMLDDDVIFLNLYRDLLEKSGYEVFVTENAYQFLLYAKELQPDIFILDINMPKVTGWEVLHRLAQDEKFAGVPVIIISVTADKAPALEKGVSHYLQKPVEPEALLEILGVYCDGNKKHDVLLLEDFVPMVRSGKEVLNEHGWSCFVVNNLPGAQLYLKKNMPKAVLVSLPEQRFSEIRRRLNHPYVLRLESYEQISQLGELIK